MLRPHSLLVPFASSSHRSPLPPLILLHRTAASGSNFLRASGGRPAPLAALRPLLADLPETDGSQEDARGIEDGPVELPSSTGSSIFAVDDNPTPLQVSTSVLLTGAISVFLFRSLRRRAKRAKELRLRSSGVEKPKTLKDEALESLKAIGASPLEAGKPPSPLQALLGGIAAGVIALILYKFTTTIEASLNRQTISDNFSVRQITITIRTIVNGICYLATFVFGVNSVGLILYAGQLALGSFSNAPATVKDDTPRPSEMAPAEGTANALESRTDEVPQNSDETKSS
ncbi:uncharacterized protein LOC122043220 [Zingiber officinale]|uniref:Uncharacterized protein n=1 Tax=Zingiber officinale TaxID=94328 RepID=A0A8J5HPK5_ZINOF|nr:uncharacterized protein LOC122043220 [Zingiber officinale]KAG6530339.1 hypothetical protein ZIOFF_012567 [Zingiber officinale]